MKRTLVPVIISGGSGSRLWPLSREKWPKQFLYVGDEHNLLQKTYLRALRLDGVNQLVTVTNRDLFFHTRDCYNQISNGKKNTCILEPLARNTAAAITAATLYAAENCSDDALLLVLPADHVVDREACFQQAVSQAMELATEGYIVTFGIQPTSAKTGYGYIQADGNKVVKFVEKPREDAAQRYFSQGGFYWNAGIFCFTARTFTSEMRKHCPAILKAVQRSFGQSQNTEYLELDAVGFSQVESISIDYALMEKSAQMAMVPCDIDWSDIGSWNEFAEQSEADSADNRLLAKSVVHNVQGSFFYSENRLIAGLGVKNLLVVDSEDAILIADRAQSQHVKRIVEELKKHNNPSYKVHQTTYRHWGKATILRRGEGFLVNLVQMNANSAQQKQVHTHRSEHWVVVSGKAKVTKGSKTLVLETNQSTYIPQKTVHKLENPYAEKLVLIEVQCGMRIDENDITVIA